MNINVFPVTYLPRTRYATVLSIKHSSEYHWRRFRSMYLSVHHPLASSKKNVYASRSKSLLHAPLFGLIYCVHPLAIVSLETNPSEVIIRPIFIPTLLFAFSLPSYLIIALPSILYPGIHAPIHMYGLRTE
jgi:hypothetical protein